MVSEIIIAMNIYMPLLPCHVTFSCQYLPFFEILADLKMRAIQNCNIEKFNSSSKTLRSFRRACPNLIKKILFEPLRRLQQNAAVNYGTECYWFSQESENGVHSKQNGLKFINSTRYYLDRYINYERELLHLIPSTNTNIWFFKS